MRALLLLCISLMAAAAQAGVGIGASVRSDDAALYVPIETSSKFMVEPYLDYGDQTDEIGTARTTSETTTVGIGIFGMANLKPNFSIYYGARLAYLRQETTSPITNFTTGEQLGVNRTELDGYSVAPSLGFQYHVMDRLRIGAEIGAEYSDVDGQTVAEIPTPTRETKRGRTRTETRTNIILRFFFK